MKNYVLRRLLLTLAILFSVSSLVFFLIHLVPGDPVDLILGEQALSADRVAFRQALHLDLPLGSQFLHFFKGLFSGDLGQSLFEHRSVSQLLWERYPATLELAMIAMVLAILISLIFGIMSAVHHGRGSLWNYGAMFGSLAGISIPHFCLGPLLVIVFSIKLDLFPISGRKDFLGFVLPALTLGSGMAAILTRMIRSSLLEVLKEDFVRTARAKGVSEWRVILKHALRVAFNPVISILGLQFGAVLAGAIVTEKIFAWPGVGSLLVQSIERRDYPVVQGCILTIAVTYSLVNLVTDLVYQKVDPRIRLGEEHR